MNRVLLLAAILLSGCDAFDRPGHPLSLRDEVMRDRVTPEGAQRLVRAGEQVPAPIAEPVFRVATESSPRAALAWVRLAQLRAAAGDRVGALEEVRLGLAYSPRDRGLGKLRASLEAEIAAIRS